MLYDKNIREPLFEFLEQTYGRIRIIEEKMMGRSRADVVMVTETELWGIEIKSDADTYARLDRQIRDYRKYYDRNLVAVGTKHALHIKEHVPDDWGIITVEETEDGPDFYLFRRPEPNPAIDRSRKLQILWRPELAHLLAVNQLPAYRQKSKEFVRKKLLDTVAPDVLDRQISEELFERDYTTIEETIRNYRVATVKRRRVRKRRRII